VQPVGAPAVQFSMSRCHGLALIAVSNGPALGVDIERINAGFPCNDIAARLMSLDDYELWRAVPASAQRRAFFRWWTRTEAYAKALGTGLTQPLTDLDLPSASSRWIIVDLEVGPRYTAALSVGRDRQGRRGNPNGEDAPE
jgi:4'-phosphopantetheinyl transferase